MTSLAALALVGCGPEQAAEESGPPAQAVQAVAASAEWTKVAPGVWERTGLTGGFERMGSGSAGFEFALQRARFEQAMMLQQQEQGGSRAALARQLTSNAKRIQFLETSVEKLRVDEAMQLVDPDPDEPPSGGSSGAPSGEACGGYYGFTITFIPGMAGGGVTTKAEWSEFGPFGPGLRTFHTYARAEMETGDFNEDSDSISFSGTCCAMSESNAGIGPTFTPLLSGSAYLFVSDGCSAARFYEAWNY